MFWQTYQNLIQEDIKTDRPDDKFIFKFTCSHKFHLISSIKHPYSLSMLIVRCIGWQVTICLQYFDTKFKHGGSSQSNNICNKKKHGNQRKSRHPYGQKTFIYNNLKRALIQVLAFHTSCACGCYILSSWSHVIIFKFNTTNCCQKITNSNHCRLLLCEIFWHIFIHPRHHQRFPTEL